MPVLLATGYSPEFLRHGPGPFAVLTKPYDATTLAKAIAELLQKGRVAEAN
jgi:hypothetical protein